MSLVKTRFAPSPTGLVHLGNARTAFFNYLYATGHGGKFLLRIEDSDQQRSKNEYVEALIEDFQWLGLKWDEGPAVGTTDTDYFQSQRLTIYSQYYEMLLQQEKAYPCFCSAKELELSRKSQLASGKPPRYSGKCSHLSVEEREAKIAAGESYTLRFQVKPDDRVEFSDVVRGPQVFEGQDIGDFIIRREDGTPAFFFCNAVDDALMEVSLVLRGEDHLSNTPRQMLILRALDLPLPGYGHFSLILGNDGAPLSKRNGSESLQDLRMRGFMPEAVCNYMGRFGHKYQQESLLTMAELAEHFSLDGLAKSPARYDEAQLIYWQKEALQNAPLERLADWLGKEFISSIPEEMKTAFLELVKSNCVFPSDAATWREVILSEDMQYDEAMCEQASLAGEDFFRAGMTLVQAHPNDYKLFLEQLKSESGLKGKGLFQPLRIVLSGRLDGPELAKLFFMLTTEQKVARFQSFIQSA